MDPLQQIKKDLCSSFDNVERPPNLPLLHGLFNRVPHTTDVSNPLLHGRNRRSLEESRKREAYLEQNSDEYSRCTKRLRFE